MKFVFLLISMLIYINSAASEAINHIEFYNQQANQVFKHTQPQSMAIGYEAGNNTPYQTWDGVIAGRSLYLELHDNKITLIHGQKKTSRRLKQAYRFPSEPVSKLDFRGTELYVREGEGADEPLICLESLPAEINRSSPRRSVFLLKNPFRNAQLYQLPALHASCRGVFHAKTGEFVIPAWKELTSHEETGYLIGFYRLAPRGFSPTGNEVRAKKVEGQEDLFRFEIPATPTSN